MNSKYPFNRVDAALPKNVMEHSVNDMLQRIINKIFLLSLLCFSENLVEIFPTNIKY